MGPRSDSRAREASCIVAVGFAMDRSILRLLIQEKLADGRLPHEDIPSIFWGGPGNGETCDGCGETVTKAQMVMELSTKDRGAHFHVACFHVWDEERRVLGQGPSGPA